ncbi:DUF551 domain-containing protein [Escherichia coli]|nr:DUF551 domain-containing protein [Escherichia coli]EJG8081940.1 DUF551 domain-containing protein [Escherichia coli]
MTTFTDKELIKEIKERIGSLDVRDNIERRAYEIALASLEAEPVSQTYKLPPLSSSEVNDAAWKLHDMLTEHGPLNGRQFNNLKSCFYEALKVAMRNSPVILDSWISCSERMPEDGQHVIILCDGAFVLYAQYRDGEFFDVVRNGDEFFETQSRNVTHWMPMPEPPHEVNRG